MTADGLLRRAQRGRQRMGLGPVRTVLYIASLGSRGTGDIEDPGGLAVRQAGVLDFLPDFRGGAGLGMNA